MVSENLDKETQAAGQIAFRIFGVDTCKKNPLLVINITIRGNVFSWLCKAAKQFSFSPKLIGLSLSLQDAD